MKKAHTSQVWLRQFQADYEEWQEQQEKVAKRIEYHKKIEAEDKLRTARQNLQESLAYLGIRVKNKELSYNDSEQEKQSTFAYVIIGPYRFSLDNFTGVHYEDPHKQGRYHTGFELKLERMVESAILEDYEELKKALTETDLSLAPHPEWYYQRGQEAFVDKLIIEQNNEAEDLQANEDQLNTFHTLLFQLEQQYQKTLVHHQNWAEGVRQMLSETLSTAEDKTEEKAPSRLTIEGNDLGEILVKTITAIHKNSQKQNPTAKTDY